MLDARTGRGLVILNPSDVVAEARERINHVRPATIWPAAAGRSLSAAPGGRRREAAQPPRDQRGGDQADGFSNR